MRRARGGAPRRGREHEDAAGLGAQGAKGRPGFRSRAGVPLSLIVKNYGWEAYFAALLAACGGALLLLAPMVNLKSYVQREAAANAKMAA